MSIKQTSSGPKFSLPAATMRAKSGTQGQFIVMIDFMERHGDLCGGLQTVQGRVNSNKKWEELTGILNSKFENDTKSLGKWRKAWSDFKSNTRKKYEKMRQEGGELILSDLEKRVLQLLASKKKIKKSQYFTAEEIRNIKDELGTDSLEGLHSPTSSPTLPGIFCAVNGTTAASRSRNNSASTQASCSSSSNQSPKKIKKEDDDESMKDITDRFIEFERERERMAHEREMARIKQHDQLLSVFNRMVNVLETLAPCIHKFLDRSNSEDG